MRAARRLEARCCAAYGSIVGVGRLRVVAEATPLETLMESEERFRALVEVTSDWIWEVGLDGVYTYASPQVESILGYTQDEVLGKTPFDLMPPEEADRMLRAALTRVPGHERLLLARIDILRRLGKKRLASTSAIASRTADRYVL